jgi:biopolymer transport protein ExbD
MKTMTYRMLMMVFALGLGADGLAVGTDYARVSLSRPSVSRKTVELPEFITLVIEGSAISSDKTLIPGNEVVDYVNKLLSVRDVSNIGIYTREGTKYGDVVRALDALRSTTAKNISLSLVELPLGQEP